MLKFHLHTPKRIKFCVFNCLVSLIFFLTRSHKGRCFFMWKREELSIKIYKFLLNDLGSRVSNDDVYCM